MSSMSYYTSRLAFVLLHFYKIRQRRCYGDGGRERGGDCGDDNNYYGIKVAQNACTPRSVKQYRSKAQLLFESSGLRGR